MHAIDEDDSENIEELDDNEEDLQACCLFEKGENEQWREVISRRRRKSIKSHC